jgi:hypothetical protein
MLIIVNESTGKQHNNITIAIMGVWTFQVAIVVVPYVIVVKSAGKPHDTVKLDIIGVWSFPLAIVVVPFANVPIEFLSVESVALVNPRTFLRTGVGRSASAAGGMGAAFCTCVPGVLDL